MTKNIEVFFEMFLSEMQKQSKMFLNKVITVNKYFERHSQEL